MLNNPDPADEPATFPGSIRLPRQKFDWLPIMKDIYEFESARISGAGSWKKDIDSVLWYFDDLASMLGLDSGQRREYKQVIDWLVKNRQAMAIQDALGQKYTTRVGETVRLLGHTIEYWHRGRPGVEAVRWLIEPKRIPKRNISVDDFIARTVQAINTKVDNRWRLSTSEVVPKVVGAIADEISERLHLERAEIRFSRFQLEACTEMVEAEFGRSAKPSQVIIAGVGSGKTFGFLAPALIGSLARLRSGEAARRSVLLIYPRKALAKSQWEAIDRVVSHISHPQLEVHFEHFDGYKARNESVKDGLKRVYGSDAPPPALIATTFETLKRRLLHPLFAKKIAKHLNRVIVDEVHLVEGLGGANVVKLIDRLHALCASVGRSRDILWTASSATVAHPHVHVGTLFGVSPARVKIIQPQEEEVETVGLAHHIFLRPSDNISSLGALVNLTSILIHNRRTDVGTRRRGERSPKTIGFADNLDLLGRWNADLRENERTEEGRDRKHPADSEKKRWEPRQREIPYAVRFRNPLQTRIDQSKEEGERYEPVFENQVGANLCNRCRSGERVSLGKKTAVEIAELAKLVYRRPNRPGDKIKAFKIENALVFSNKAQEVGTLDLCPYLRAGACFWFPSDTEEVEKIQGTKSRFEWKSIARSKVHSSKTSGTSDVAAEDLADVVFRGSLREIYDITESDDTNLPIDIVLASPSLEVGIDLQNVTESIMFHAIRNVASYRQKAGRIGREEGSDSLNVTLIDNRPIDLHFYRQPRKLVRIGQLDPIPLKDTNKSVLLNSLYLSVWDWLALRTEIPESVTFGSRGNEYEFTIGLRKSAALLKESRLEVAKHLSEVSRGRSQPESAEIQDAITQVESEIKFLLTDVRGLFEPDIQYLSDIVPNLLSEHGKRIIPSQRAGEVINRIEQEYSETYRRLRPRIDHIALGLSEEFHSLDLMEQCGWTLERLEIPLHKIGEAKSRPDFANDDLEELSFTLNRIKTKLLQLGSDPKPLYFFRQYGKFVDANKPAAYYLSYIMENLDVFKLFRLKPEYARLKNLFTNPYEDEVTVARKYSRELRVTLDEALFSLIPGSWTYRFSKRALKTNCGRVKTTKGGIARVSLDQLNQAGNRFVKVRENIHGPPGLPRGFDVMRPTRLEAFELPSKYVRLDRNTGTIADGDERESRSDSPDDDWKQVKVPKTYMNKWVHVNPSPGEHLSVIQQDIRFLTILSRDGNIEQEGNDALLRIRHPLAALFEGAYWHSDMEVTEFVYSCSRTYSNLEVSGVELLFDGPGAPMAFGRSFRTEGLSFELQPQIVQAVAQSVLEGILNGSTLWAPSSVKAFSAYLTDKGLQTSSSVSPFLVRDFVSVLLIYIGHDNTDWSPALLAKKFRDLLGNQSAFLSVARQYYQGTSLVEKQDEESFQQTDDENESRTLEELETKVNRLWDTANSLSGLDDLEASVGTWVANTLVNSFGMAASTALQRVAGVSEGVVGHSVDYEGIKKGKYRVFFYDKDAHGSGSCEVIRRFFHILHIQRHGENEDSRLLPSEDFYTAIEEELLQCPQHHTDLFALEVLGQRARGEIEQGIPALGYIGDQAKEVLSNCELVWAKLGIRGREDAWKLPILGHQVEFLARDTGIELDDLIRATTICWNGCPECLMNREANMGGPAGELLIDKAILNEWFRHGRSKSGEYLEADLESLAKGRVGLPFGKLSRVVLNLPNRRIRSVSLPYTIGIDASENVCRLVIRSSDIEGLSLFDTAGALPKSGIESLGFKRLFWHDLILTAYLDLLGLIETGRRSIRAVFYDCREISFEDVGVSPRMLDAITEHARGQNLTLVPETLSDMLIWFARRGYNVSICVDKTRLAEEGVKRFVDRLLKGGCKVYSKELSGIMHKKAFVTPLGAIIGSANLTQAGTSTNEEILSYAQIQTQSYFEIDTAVKDTFYGAIPI